MNVNLYLCLYDACNFVEQLYGKSLSEFSFESENCADAVNVVCECVAEIRNGLMSECTAVQSCHWDLKLTAICTWRTLASYASHTGNDVPASVPNCDIIHSLPHWNFTFYFGIVMQNKWTKYLVEVVKLLFIYVSINIYMYFCCTTLLTLSHLQQAS